MKVREEIQWRSASYFTTQTSYPRAQEFRDKVTRHKEPRKPLNSHKYSFVRPEQTAKWYLCAWKVAVLIKQAGDRCTALKSRDAIL